QAQEQDASAPAARDDNSTAARQPAGTAFEQHYAGREAPAAESQKTSKQNFLQVSGAAGQHVDRVRTTGTDSTRDRLRRGQRESSETSEVGDEDEDTTGYTSNPPPPILGEDERRTSRYQKREHCENDLLCRTEWEYITSTPLGSSSLPSRTNAEENIENAPNGGVRGGGALDVQQAVAPRKDETTGKKSSSVGCYNDVAVDDVVVETDPHDDDPLVPVLSIPLPTTASGSNILVAQPDDLGLRVEKQDYHKKSGRGLLSPTGLHHGSYHEEKRRQDSELHDEKINLHDEPTGSINNSCTPAAAGRKTPEKKGVSTPASSVSSCVGGTKNNKKNGVESEPTTAKDKSKSRNSNKPSIPIAVAPDPAPAPFLGERSIFFQNQKLHYDSEEEFEEKFVPTRNELLSKPLFELATSAPLTTLQSEELRKKFGKNEVEIEIPRFWQFFQVQMTDVLNIWLLFRVLQSSFHFRFAIAILPFCLNLVQMCYIAYCEKKSMEELKIAAQIPQIEDLRVLRADEAAIKKKVEQDHILARTLFRTGSDEEETRRNTIINALGNSTRRGQSRSSFASVLSAAVNKSPEVLLLPYPDHELTLDSQLARAQEEEEDEEEEILDEKLLQILEKQRERAVLKQQEAELVAAFGLHHNAGRADSSRNTKNRKKKNSKTPAGG
ncbi:unnamed protein product, partial [Amoebophrya sp. A120]